MRKVIKHQKSPVMHQINLVAFLISQFSIFLPEKELTAFENGEKCVMITKAGVCPVSYIKSKLGNYGVVATSEVYFA